MPEKPYEFPPFSSPLEKAEDLGAGSRSEKIRQLQEDPEVIVREIEAKADLFGLGKKDAVQIAKKEFDSLRDEYGMPVNAEYVMVGKDEADARIYAVTDRVHEDSISSDERESRKGELLGKILSYYRDKIATYDSQSKTIDYFLQDVDRMSQFVYGHTTQDPKPKFHLVDIDPQYVSNSLDGLIDSIQHFDADFLNRYVLWAKQNGKSLENIRRPLLDIIRSLEQIETKEQDPHFSYSVAELKRKLEDIFSL